jgi:hypothetical protein
MTKLRKICHRHSQAEAEAEAEAEAANFSLTKNFIFEI